MIHQPITAFLADATWVAALLSPWTVLTYATVSVVLLFLVNKTRLAVLYVVKSIWVAFTILAFLWVLITSMGSNDQYVNAPSQAVAQFADRHSHGTFAAGVGAVVAVVFMVLLGFLWPGKASDVGRQRKLIAVRVAVGLLAGAGLLVSAHFNGYRHWWENYTTALLVARMADYTLNSVLVTVATVVLTTCIASMAAYALSKLEFFGRDAFLYLFIAGFAIPGQLILVPLFLMMRNWTIPGIGFAFMDSRLALILIYTATDLPFTIFLLTAFFASLPTELGEAAAIDGCGEFNTFRQIYFPLAMPGLTTAAIFNFLGVWNEYNFALVFITNPQLKTLPVGLYMLNVSQQYAANWPALFAGIVILWAPTFLIFLLMQRQIIAGLTLGSVKG
jgi:ABC-type glycerol-3-phosphate transport system permease component